MDVADSATPAPRSTTRATSTMPAASGSSRTRVGGRGRGSCHWPWPGSPRSAHRGAFGADGASSDGAGISFPLDRVGPPADRRRRPRADRTGRRHAVPAARACSPSEPHATSSTTHVRRRRAAGRRLADRAARSLRAGCGRRGHRARRSPRPSSRDRPSRRRSAAARRRRVRAPARRRPPPSGDRGPRCRRTRWPDCPCRPRRPGRSSTRASSPASRLADLYPDLRAPLDRRVRDLPPALRDEHHADLGARPAVPVDRPQRRDQHGPRQPRAGPRPDPRPWAPGRSPRELTAAGPLLSPGRLRLAVARRGPGAADDDRLGPRPGAARGHPRGARVCVAAPHPHVATLRRRTAGMLAPWDGPAAIVFADGKRVGALIDRNGLRPASFAVSRDRLVVVASEAGAVPLPASETIRRGRLGPGEMLLVEPGRRAILEDTDAKAWALRQLPDPRRPAPAPRGRARGRRGDRSRTSPGSTTSPATSSGSTPNAPGSTSRRWRSRPTSRCGAWATTRRPPVAPASTGRSPTTSARPSPRSPTRPSTRSASGSSWTCGSSSGAARRCSAVRRAARARLRLERPIVADLDGLRRALREPADRDPRCSMRRGRRRPVPTAWPPPWTRWRATAVRAAEARRRGPRRQRCRGCRSSGCPVPVDPRRRRRPHRADRRRPARPDRHRGRRRRRPRRPRHGDGPRGRGDRRPPATGPRAGRRAGRHARRGRAVTPAGAIDNLVAAFEAGLRKTLARMGISAVASYIGGSLVDTVDLAPDVIARCFPMAAAWPGRTTLADLADRAAPTARGRAGPASDPGRPRAAPARPRLRPVPRRRRGAPLLAGHRQGDPGPVRLAPDGRRR